MTKNMSLLTCKLSDSDESSTVVHIGGTRLLIALKYLLIIITPNKNASKYLVHLLST
jgi:hypothetical protein